MRVAPPEGVRKQNLNCVAGPSGCRTQFLFLGSRPCPPAPAALHRLVLSRSLPKLGGTIRERESKWYEIKHVPAPLRNRPRTGGQVAIQPQYLRAVFDKDLLNVSGKPSPAAFLSRGTRAFDKLRDVEDFGAGAVMATEIYFPSVEPLWEFDRDCVRFYAVVNQQTVVCLISAEALYRFFGAPNFEASEAIAAFKGNRPQIEEAVRRKICETGERNIREVLLTMKDFQTTTTTTTTTTPSPNTEQNTLDRVKIHLYGDAVHNPLLEKLARSATTLLAMEIVRSPSMVTAAWTGMASTAGLLLYLRLVDEDTKATAENLFTAHDLENESVARFALFRLYDDLLRAKGAVLKERYQQSEAAGGKS